VAKRFQFRLQTLLRVRELREREAKRKVGAKLAEIARLDQLNHQAAEEIAQHHDVLRAHQQRRILASDVLVCERAWIAHLRGTIARRQTTRAELVRQLEELQEELRRARTQKRIIEKLRERRWEEYVTDRKRREQAESDELAQQLHASDRSFAATGTAQE
jgi:flagellar FliJ protein